jgi:hypothetical protein
MFRSSQILFGAMLFAGVQTAAAEPRSNVADTSAAPSCDRCKLVAAEPVKSLLPLTIITIGLPSR